MRHLPKTYILLLLALIAAACRQSPPTQYLMEVTREVTIVHVVTVTPEGFIPTQSPPEESPTGTMTPTPTLTPGPTHTPTLTPTLDPFPTPINAQVIVAEQLFERGRMFWLQPNQAIWVMVNGEDNSRGQWIIHTDTWLEGMPEFDPEIVPPEGLFQPERGFGKLWRDNAAVRDAVGWAIDTEYGHVTTYQYFAGGEVTPDGEYIAEPGYHTLVSRYGGTFMFDESSRTWRRGPGT